MAEFIIPRAEFEAMMKSSIILIIISLIASAFFYSSFLWLAIYSFKENFLHKNTPIISTPKPTINIIAFRIVTIFFIALMLHSIGSTFKGFIVSVIPIFNTEFHITAIHTTLIDIAYVLSLALIYTFYIWLAKSVLKLSFFPKRIIEVDNKNSPTP